MEDSFGIIGVIDLSADAKNVAAFSGVVLDVVISALVGELRHFDLLRCELLVKIEEIETGWWQVFDAGKKYSGLQLRHWSLKLWWNECKRLVFDAERFVEVN